MNSILVYQNGYMYWTIRVRLPREHKFFHLPRPEKLRLFKNFDFDKSSYRVVDGQFYARTSYCQCAAYSGSLAQALMCAFDFATKLHELDPIQDFDPTEKRAYVVRYLTDDNYYDPIHRFVVDMTLMKNKVDPTKIKDVNKYIRKNGVNYRTCW